MSEHYFQFPVSALSFGMHQSGHRSRWADVLDYACLHYGRKALSEMPPHVSQDAIAAYLQKRPQVSASMKDRDQQALVLGFDRLNVNAASGSFKARLEEATTVAQHCAGSPYPTVRIRTDFWWKTFMPENQESPISFREFAVLCAVYAAVGAKPYAKASLQMLRRYAAGYPKEADFQAALSELRPGSLYLSPKQVRTTLDALEANQFFAKFTFNGGECFYSNKMKKTELCEAIARRKLRKLETVASLRTQDAQASADILRRRALARSAAKASCQ